MKHTALMEVNKKHSVQPDYTWLGNVSVLLHQSAQHAAVFWLWVKLAGCWHKADNWMSQSHIKQG